jgi:hypothetical protein
MEPALHTAFLVKNVDLVFEIWRQQGALAVH